MQVINTLSKFENIKFHQKFTHITRQMGQNSVQPGSILGTVSILSSYITFPINYDRITQ